MNVMIYKKLLATFSFIFLVLCNIIAYWSPSEGYELSIYKSTPILYWFFLMLSITGGALLIIFHIYNKKSQDDSFYLLGFLILTVSRISLLVLPYIRGYYGWRGDSISHLGYVSDVFFTGFISSENPYPITHVLISIVSLLSDISIQNVANFSSSLISVFYVVSLYLLSYEIFDRGEQKLLVFSLIGCVLFNDYDIFLRPNAWSFLVFPLVLYFYFKNGYEFKILLVLFLILYPFFHPLSALMVIISFTVIGISQVMILNLSSFRSSFKSYFPFTLIAIITCVLCMWVLSFKIFYLNISSLFESIITGHGSIGIEGMSSRLDTINLHGIDLLKLVFKMEGDDIIFIMFSFVAILFTFKELFLHKYINSKYTINLFSLEVLFLVTGFFYLSYLFGIIPGLNNIGGERFKRFLVLFTPILSAFSIFEISKKLKSKKFAACFIIFIIILSSSISIFSLYRSPYILQPANSITTMDMKGMEWYINYKNSSVGSVEIMSPPERFSDVLYGYSKSQTRYDLTHSQKIPDHFNYTFYDYVGCSYSVDKYLAITQFDRIIYTTVWKVVGRYSDVDFSRIENDLTVYKLYTNKETTVYYINSKSK